MNRRTYSRAELLSIMLIEKEHGTLTYRRPLSINVEEVHFKNTGVRRSSGCLYMAAWRLHKGRYDHLLHEKIKVA